MIKKFFNYIHFYYSVCLMCKAYRQHWLKSTILPLQCLLFLCNAKQATCYYPAYSFILLYHCSASSQYTSKHMPYSQHVCFGFSSFIFKLLSQNMQKKSLTGGYCIYVLLCRSSQSVWCQTHPSLNFYCFHLATDVIQTVNRTQDFQLFICIFSFFKSYIQFKCNAFFLFFSIYYGCVSGSILSTYFFEIARGLSNKLLGPPQILRHIYLWYIRM